MRQLVLLTLLLGGCTWITEADLNCQLELVDDDGDGYALNQVEEGYDGNDRCGHLVVVDCDDADASIHPDAEDDWYDGIDADCQLDDDYDQDADGYVLDEHEGVATEGVDGSGALPGGDCDDELPGVNPDGSDVAYDGVDADCGGDDDYDQDGDGYVADEYQGLATDYVEGSGSLPGGDCDDSDSAVMPGATDSWYDGVDTDCGGEDDYDQDGDGYVLDEYAGLETTYVDGSGALPGGDCDDEDDAIHAGAKDVWYDGIDSDCAEDDDYDQDLDGYQDAATAKDGEDCDDTDATSYPGAVEILGELVDHDCDGDGGTFTLSDLEEFTWVAPQELDLASNADGIYLGLSAEELSQGSTDYFDSAIAVVWDPADLGAGYSDVVGWVRNFADPGSNVLTPGLGIHVTDDVLYGVVGIETATTRQLVVRGYEMDSAVGYGANPPVTATLSFEDASVAIDASGNVHGVGCTSTPHDDALAYLWAAPDTLTSNHYDDTLTLPLEANACQLDFFDAAGQGTMLVSRVSSPVETELVVYTFEPPVDETSVVEFTEAAVETGYSILELEVHQDGVDRLVLLADGLSSTVYLERLTPEWTASTAAFLGLPGSPVAAASVAFAPDGMAYVVAVDQSGELSLASGMPGDATRLSAVPFLDLDILVYDAAIWVSETGDQLLLVAQGYDLSTSMDRILWGYADIAVEE